MKCSIIIVNYKVPELLRTCIRSVQQQTSVPYEIIVVDNDSNDHSVAMLRSEFPEVKVIASVKNLGFAAGNNLGLTYAVGEYIFYLNPDTELREDAVGKLCAILDEDERVGLAAPKLLNSDGSLQRSIRPFYGFWSSLFDNRFMAIALRKNPRVARFMPGLVSHEYRQEVDWAKGAAFMVRRKVIDQIGAFDERFWIYAEEIDFCYRMKKRGWKRLFDPAISVVHHESQSVGPKNDKMALQNHLSFLLFLKKHYPAYSYRLYYWRSQVFRTVWRGIGSVAQLLNKQKISESLSGLKVLQKEAGSLESQAILISRKAMRHNHSSAY